MQDTSGMELGRVRANVGVIDREVGDLRAGDERDVELTPNVRALVASGLLELLEEYPDPASEASGP